MLKKCLMFQIKIIKLEAFKKLNNVRLEVLKTHQKYLKRISSQKIDSLYYLVGCCHLPKQWLISCSKNVIDKYL